MTTLTTELYFQFDDGGVGVEGKDILYMEGVVVGVDVELSEGDLGMGVDDVYVVVEGFEGKLLGRVLGVGERNGIAAGHAQLLFLVVLIKGHKLNI